jgi:hypothetical protein
VHIIPGIQGVLRGGVNVKKKFLVLMAEFLSKIEIVHSI